MANKITTVFDAEVRGFRDGVKQIKKDVSEAEGAVGKLKAGWKGAAAEFKNSRAAQAAVGAAAVKIAKDSIDAASNLEESANAVSTTFEDASGDISALAEHAATKYGLSQRAFNELAVGFSGFASKIVGEGGNVAATVDDMATRVSDFASVHNLEMSDAVTKFQSALAGETEAMRRYGIDVSAAAVTQYALSEGLVNSKDEMTEAIKVQARYGLLMRETDQWAGDFAATSDGLANSQRILNAQIENLQAQLGEHLVPALAESTSQLNELLATAEKLKLVDLGAEFAKWGDLSPAGFKKRFDEVKDAATSTKFSFEDFDGTVDELRAELDRLGIDGAEAAKGIEWYEKKTATATTATDDLTSSLSQQDAARAANHTATIMGANAKEQEAKAALIASEAMRDEARAAEHTATVLGKTTKAQDDAAAAAKKHAERLEDITEAFSELNDQMSDRDAWYDVLDAVDDFDQAVKDAEEAEKEFGAGSREAAAANREMERSLMGRIQAIINYVTEAENIPEEKITDIKALLDQGSVAEAEAILAQLERSRTATITARTIVRNAPSSDFGGAGGMNGPRASGGPTFPGLHPVIENGPELLEQDGKTYLMSKGGGNVVPLNGGTSGGGGAAPSGGVQVHIGNITTQARNGQELLDEFTAALRRQGPSAIRRALGLDG